jgi:spoIIIJ-associated protein
VSGTPRRFFSGDTEAQAVIEAAGHFGLSPGELAYRPVEKKHGFLRRPRVVIEVDPAAPRRTAPAAPAEALPSPGRSAEGRGPSGARPASRERPHPEPRREARATGAPAAPEVFSGPLVGPDGAQVAAELLAALCGLRLSAAATAAAGEDGEELRVELDGEGRAALLARQGELLRSVEHLLRRMVRELPPGGLTLDSGGFRQGREEALRRRAAAAAEEVRRSGAPVVFEPLPAADRRILHLAVRAEPGLQTASEGEGELRRVRVSLAPDADLG